MIEKIWDILTTLTEQARSSALAKCNELGFDPNRGVVSLEESFINLDAVRSILMDAIEKRKLIQLPITVQKVLLAQLEAIAKSLTGLTGGADEVVNLVDRIEQLNTATWQYGLHNLSEEVLGYQTKINQLKSQELEAGKVKEELERALKRKKELEGFLEEAKKSVETLQSRVTTSDEQSKKITEGLTHTTEIEQKAGALLATVQQNETTTTQLLANTKNSNAEVTGIETRIKDFFGQIDEYRNKIAATSESAEKAMQQNKAETDTLISTLKDLEDKIKDQIARATGFSLFHSFQTRQEAIARSKKFWGRALAVVVCISVGWSFFLFFETTNLDTIFYLKLSMAIPLIYAITFCNLQYSRERRLEEEYAFKSNISISLVPYKDLVEKLINKDNPVEIEKFASFIIESVSKVFTSPNEKVFDSETRDRGVTPRSIKQLAPLIDAVAKLKG
jgi:predicted  nucleic acid-binding Zn-ribbon protein